MSEHTHSDTIRSTSTSGPAGALERLSVAVAVARLGAERTLADRAVELKPGAQIPEVVFRTRRLTLRPWWAGDRAEFLRVLEVSREALARSCPLWTLNAPGGEQAFDRQLALSQAAMRSGRGLRLIALDERGRIIGGFNVNDISRGLEHRGEITAWIASDAHNHGYATEGLLGLLEHAFADLPSGLGLHRVTGLIAPDNAPCLTLAKKVGLALGGQPPVDLVVDGHLKAHDVYEAFAPIFGVVEPKPSLDPVRIDRALSTILRTEVDLARRPVLVEPAPADGAAVGSGLIGTT